MTGLLTYVLLIRKVPSCHFPFSFPSDKAFRWPVSSVSDSNDHTVYILDNISGYQSPTGSICRPKLNACFS